MRITTNILNESARKAGLTAVNSTTLLNGMNSTTTKNTLLNALNKGNNTADKAKKSGYEKLGKEADELQKKADIFAGEGEKSIFAKAKESGSNQEIYDAIKELVEQYNDTASALKSNSGPLNDYYRQMLKDAALENSEDLGSIGITVTKNGTLGIDEEKLHAADVDELEKVLGGSSDFIKKTSFLATRISDNAQANRDSLSSQYTASGTTYNAATGRYDFKG
ncbi:MAG: hypothetical protein HDR26_05130 [Lachnospiraceae bacterium]|nr:hypothetical protein [Lachnospiraceae bacterium]